MITISLCLIVKNEEKVLGNCLGSVEGIADEIIVVDTGSTDATKEVAQRFGARVCDFEWIYDFSAARNYSFAQARMDYIMWLDADDVLLPEDRTKLLALKQNFDTTLDAVTMMYNYNFDETGNVTETARRIRLARRSMNFTWKGYVHEDLSPDTTYRYLDSDIIVTHNKLEAGPSHRNIEIYEKHMREGHELRSIDLFQYALEMEAVNQGFEKAIEYYEKFLQRPERDTDLNMTMVAMHRLARCYYMAGHPEKEWETTLRSLEMDVPRPEFCCRMGERFLQREKWRQAAFWYELAIQNPAGEERVVQNYPFRTWLPHKQLGLCYYRLGDYPNSLRHNESALQYMPQDPDIHTNIGVLKRLIEKSAAAG